MCPFVALPTHLSNIISVVSAVFVLLAQATADPNENIVALLKKVNSNNISNVPVVDENKRLLGLITNSSLVTTMSQQFIDFEEGEA